MPRIIEEPKPIRPAYFWWLLANGLALCFAVISWAVCLHVFGNPEVPRNYRLLQKIGRQPVLKPYTILNVPNGNALSPKELYQKFFSMADSELERTNKLMLRNYLTGFGRPLLLAYVEGDYRVAQARPAVGLDLFEPGCVVLAQALVKPDEFTPARPYPVWLELLVPTKDKAAVDVFKPGSELPLRKSPHCLAVLRAARVTVDGEDVLQLTVVPILYGLGQFGGQRPLEMVPPDVLRLEALPPAAMRVK